MTDFQHRFRHFVISGCIMLPCGALMFGYWHGSIPAALAFGTLLWLIFVGFMNVVEAIQDIKIPQVQNHPEDPADDWKNGYQE